MSCWTIDDLGLLGPLLRSPHAGRVTVVAQPLPTPAEAMASWELTTLAQFTSVLVRYLCSQPPSPYLHGTREH